MRILPYISGGPHQEGDQFQYRRMQEDGAWSEWMSIEEDVPRKDALPLLPNESPPFWHEYRTLVESL